MNAVSPFVDEGQNKKDNKGKNKKLFHDPMFTKPTKQKKNNHFSGHDYAKCNSLHFKYRSLFFN